MKKLITTLLLLMIIHLELILSTSDVSRNIILDTNDESNLNDRMSLIEANNQQQEKEISFLKAARVEDKRDIRHLTRRLSRLESLLAAKNSVSSEKLLMRPKRPYRLLPASQIENDQVNTDKTTDPTFYGPATNCGELGVLGYTLNGYYLVKGKDEFKSIEAVFCRFKLPRESKTGATEERLGLVSTYARVEKSQAIVTTKPTTSSTSSTTSITMQKTKNLNGEYFFLGGTARKTTTITYFPLDHGINESFLLMNVESGKCLGSRAPSHHVQTLDCNSSSAKRWKFLNDRKQLCDIKSAQCISVPIQDGNILQFLYLLPMLGGESGEKNCKECLSAQKQFAQRVSVVQNQIRIFYGTLKKVNNSYISDRLGCLTARNIPGPFLHSEVELQLCNESHKNQTWSFVFFD